MSPDWSANPDPVPYADFDDPQSLNLCAYVGNNLLKSVYSEAMNRNGEHNFPNYLGISLWVSSKELTPDRITQIVGIEPNHVRVRGTLIPGRGVSRRPEFDVHEWQFR